MIATRPFVRAWHRLSQWEFWPTWAFYAPLLPWFAWLALRHGGLRTVTAANPGIPDGGTVGESKARILAQLPADVVLPFRTVGAGTASTRRADALAAVAAVGGTYPVILKPDVGERGRGVRLARSAADVERYCDECTETFLVQRYHPGPFEAGIFYFRIPGEPRGRILSITDKRFPAIIGDGMSTVEAIIRQHPRYRMQAAVFLARHAGQRQRVLAAGESMRLAVAGNHSKGTTFLDGDALRTPRLETAVDAIAQRYPGFFIGRFDVRYSSVEAFRDGRDLAIVELNGATAEPTDLYDPAHSVVEGWRRLARQWRLVFEIGAANRRAGAPVTPVVRLAHLLLAHRRLVPLRSD